MEIEQPYTLDNLAFLYTSTASGKNSGIRFMLEIEDAKKFCSSPISKGKLHGSEWIYCWTSIRNFINRDSDYDDPHPVIDISKVVDNGAWDEKIASVIGGGRKIDVKDFAQYLEPLGITLKVGGNHR